MLLVIQGQYHFELALRPEMLLKLLIDKQKLTREIRMKVFLGIQFMTNIFTK